jgi:hypothetical protein
MTAAAYLVTIAEMVRSDLAAGPGLNVAGTALQTGEEARIAAPIVVTRGYVPRFKPSSETPGVFQVFVSSNSRNTKRVDRSTLEVYSLIDIAVRCNLVDQAESTIDAAMGILEQIADYQFDYGLSQPYAAWMSNDVIFWPDRDGLSKSKTFFALWTATFLGTTQRRIAY